MASLNFIDKIRGEILLRIHPSARPAVERSLDRLAGLGIDSIESALALARGAEGDVNDRAAAVWCLGQTRESGIANEIVSLLEPESDSRLVWELAKAAVTSTPPSDRLSITARLLELLKVSLNPEKRSAIVFALGLLGSKSAIAPLSALLLDSGEMLVVREHAAEALGALATDEALEALLAGLSAQPLHLQVAIARALGEAAHAGVIQVLEELAATAKLFHDELQKALDQARHREPRE